MHIYCRGAIKAVNFIFYCFQMPKSQTTPLHASKTKITCRICGPDQPQILRQCYKHHLKTAHNDVTGNLREWGQASLAGFSKGEKSTTTHNEEIDGSKRSCPETLVNNISCEDVSGDIEMTRDWRRKFT